MTPNGRTHVERALKGLPSDRIPCFPLIDLAFASAYCGYSLADTQTNPQLHAEALSRCARELPVDGVYVNLALDRGQGKRLDRRTLFLDEALTVVIPERDVLSIAKTDIKTLYDPRIISADLFHPGMLEAYKNMPEEILRESAVVVGLTGTFSQLAFLFGVQNLLTAVLDSPELVDKALERRHETVLRQAEGLCDAGVRFVWIGEGLGSGSLISPAQYARFVLPYERDIAGRLRDRNVLSILHICGNTRNSLAHIAKSGVDGFDLDYPVPVEEAFETLSPRITVKGNINPRLFLPGNEQELETACGDLLSRTGAWNGFILSTGCLVPRDSGREAFSVMRRACNEKKRSAHYANEQNRGT